MTIQGIKESTKDADAIVEPPEPHGALIEGLETAGFERYTSPVHDELEPPAKARLEGWEVWMGPISLDLFPPHRIFGDLSFTPAMMARSKPWKTFGRLEVRLADPSTILLLKSVTGRWHNEPRRDLEDLESIIASKPIDWEFVAHEWSAAPRSMKATTHAREAVAYLKGKGNKVPWKP